VVVNDSKERVKQAYTEQESCAIAKMIERCALYKQALKNYIGTISRGSRRKFSRPHYNHTQANFSMDGR